MFKSNINKIIRQIEKWDERAEIALEQGMFVGMRLFEGKMIKEQFSGRKTARSSGVNRVTGTAAASWTVRGHGTGRGYRVTLSNAPRAWYILLHQHAEGYEPQNGINRPKRLHIPEDFEKSGPKLIRKAMINELLRIN